jgi:hypothetical protein
MGRAPLGRPAVPLDGTLLRIDQRKRRLAISPNDKATQKVVNFRQQQTSRQLRSSSSVVYVVSVMHGIENRNRKMTLGAEIDGTSFADFRENLPDTISDISIVRCPLSTNHDVQYL